MGSLSYISNDVDDDVLETQIGRASAAMVLTYFAKNIPVPAPGRFIFVTVSMYANVLFVQVVMSLKVPHDHLVNNV